MCVWWQSHLKRETLCAGDETNQHEKYDGFADTQTLKTFTIARAANQRHMEHGHRQFTSILDTCFHTNMDEMIHARPQKETVFDLSCEF